MPPKKNEKEDPNDVKGLPPWTSMTSVLNFCTKKKYAQKTRERLLKKPLSFQRIITREELVSFAKEKGFYVDPNNLTDKQKKDPKALTELPTELTPFVMAKTFKQFIIEQDLQGRKLKKDKLDGKLNPVPVAEKKNVPVPVAKDPKKDPKKDQKSGAVTQVVEEKKEEEPPEKEYEKALDTLYISLDYPSNEEEYRELNEGEFAFDVFINVDETVVIGEVSANWEKLASLQSNFDDDIRTRLEEFVEKGEKNIRLAQNKDPSGKTPRKTEEEIDEEDKTFKTEGENHKKMFLNLRKKVDKADPIKNTFVLNKQFLVEKKPEELLVNRFLDELAQDVCGLSFDTIKYKEWIKSRSTRPFIPEKRLENIETTVSRPATAHALEKPAIEPPKVHEDPKKAAATTNTNAPPPKGGLKKEAAGPPKDQPSTAKDVKKDVPSSQGPLNDVVAPTESQPQQQGLNMWRQTTEGMDMRRSTASNASSTYDKGGAGSGLQYYQRLLNKIDEEKISTGLILESLLDEIEFTERKKEVKRYPSVNLTNFAQAEDKAEKVPDMIKGKSSRKLKAADTHAAEKKQMDEASAKLVLAGEIPALKETFLEENTIEDLKKIFAMYEDLERDDFRQPLLKKIKMDNDPNELGSKFKTILNFADELSLRAEEKILSNLDSIKKRETQIFSKIFFPGVERHMMPSKPTVTENLRKSKYAKLQAFSNIPEGEFERRRILVRFEEMLKKAVPERQWNLSKRTYQERLDSSSLAQTLYSAMLYEPYVLTEYDPEQDYLYLLLYFHNPPGRILRQKWSAPWRVMPSLENWVYHFKDNEQNLRNKLFYDVDPEAVGNVFESKKLMFPSDNSIIFCSRYQIGDLMSYRYLVLKDGFTFGVRNHPKESGGSVFWLRFNNNTRLTVELDEEGGEKGLKRRRSLDFKVIPDLSGNNPATFPSKVDQSGLRKTSITMTLENGLIVRFLNNGDVLQSVINSKKQENRRYFEEIVTPLEERLDLSQVETSRIITGRGTVIKNMKDGSTQILFANGNISINKRNGVWVSTNNKGMRKGRRIKDGMELEMDSVDLNNFNDYETNSNVIVREDETVIITFSDGAVKTRHKDGTIIFTSAKKDLITVSHANFATVKIRYDEVKARMATVIGWGGGFSSVGYSDIMERSHDGRVTETLLPDNTLIKGYREKKELPGYNRFQENYNYLVFSADSSSLRLQDNGEIVVISAEDRIRLNDKGEKKALPNDIDYFLNLMNAPEERGEGVYTVELEKKLIWTVDGEGNSFKFSATGDIDVNIAVSLNIKSSEDDENERPKSPNIKDGDYVPEENRFLPEPGDFIEPRIFTVRGDGTSFELHSAQQLSNYFRLMDMNKSALKLEDHNVPGRKECYSVSYVKRVENKERKAEDEEYPLPRSVQILPQTFQRQAEPLKSTFVYRNFLVYKEFDEDAREEYLKVLEEYDKWVKKELETKNSYKILTKTEEEKDREFNVQLKILEARKKKEMETWDH